MNFWLLTIADKRPYPDKNFCLKLGSNDFATKLGNRVIKSSAVNFGLLSPGIDKRLTITEPIEVPPRTS